MDLINILIPMADGHSLAPEVVRGISMQTVDCRVFPLTRPMDMQDKRISEAESRNLLRQYTDGEFCMMMDAGTILTSPTDIEDAISALTQRVDYDALAYNTKIHKTADALAFDVTNRHIDIGCMIIRSEVLRRITFRSVIPKSCLCVTFNQDCKIGWVDFRQLREVKA
jgi:hypothetical protein